MSDLIRRDPLLNGLKAKEYTENTYIQLAPLIDVIEKCPAADAVEVVRCGKCVYRHKFMQDIYYCTKDGFFNDNLPNRIVKETDFCSFGRRREENAVD